MEIPDLCSNNGAHCLEFLSELMISHLKPFWKSVYLCFGSITFTATLSLWCTVPNKKRLMTLKNAHSVYFFRFSQVNSSIHVNSVGVPDSDLMATNGVIHVVKNVLYPAGEDSIHYHTFRQTAHHADSHYIKFSWWCNYLQTFLWVAKTSWSSWRSWLSTSR